MQELGLALPFWLTVGIWIARIVVLVFICILLAWLGIRALDASTPHIHERQRIGEHPIATGLFIAGYFILIGLVIHGAATAHTMTNTPISYIQVTAQSAVTDATFGVFTENARESGTAAVGVVAMTSVVASGEIKYRVVVYH